LKKKVGAISKVGENKATQKSEFLGFTPKPLPITDFGVHHWKKHKNHNQNKKTKFKLFDIFSSRCCKKWM